MIYITGDTHGSFDDVEEFCKDNFTVKDDILIILGDAGINYYGDPQDRRLKNRLSELPITLFCIHGNHEMRPESISTYDEVERFGGVVYCESEFPNLLFAKDGEIYEFNKRRCIAIGGAYSIDRWSRTPGVDWWDDEQPSDAVKEYVESRLKAKKWKVDVVLSHTCPLKYMPTEAFLPGINKRDADNDTEEWLDTIEKKLNYSEWWCGHFHTEKYIAKMRFLYNNIIEFEEDY